MQTLLCYGIVLNYLWILNANENKEKVSELSEKLAIQPTLAKVLIRRGINDIETANKFFNPSLDDLLDPFLMDDMDKAVNRILKGIENKEQFWIHGDYDVDGTSSVSMITLFLRESGAIVDYFIPDRFHDGFGINDRSIQNAIKNNAKILITVDVGITSFEMLDLAASHNIDTIICDHHEPAEILPKAFAILDPLKHNSNYSFKSLSACGVVFKLIQAISTKLGNPDMALKYLDFVALATAADMVPLIDENRIMLHYGLHKINTNPRTGFKSLIYCSGINQNDITTSNIIYSIAPLINAAGRLGHANRSVELMTNPNEIKCFQIAQQLEDENRKRRAFDQKLYDAALPIAEKDYNSGKHSLVIYGEGWHTGVVGIVASRLVDRFHSPVVLLSNIDNYARGSARCPHNFDMYAALKKCENLLIEFGGHKHAAGITLELDKIDEFKNTFEDIAKEALSKDMLLPNILIDAEINFNDLSPAFFKIINKFSPFGFANPKPIFLTKGVQINNGIKQLSPNKIRFRAIQGNFVIDAVAYNLNSKLDILRKNNFFSVAYNLETHSLNGRHIPQINIKDIQIEERD
ncbi:MAG: single-stranded-DNA-specific exonuclease RecJ [Bacteroidetes bacterium]|nr:single-stranded-DNA-specific exonuclease RecJ [Bacteroidota bacterium]